MSAARPFRRRSLPLGGAARRALRATSTFGPNPWQPQSWDWRAACNFMAGGAGSGLIVFAALAGPSPGLLVAGAVLVALGLLAVWFEIGRPWRALNVIRHARSSWMSRESLLAPLLLGAALAAAFGVPLAGALAMLSGLAFAYCQGRILQAAKGIPAWREPLLVPLIVATGLAEGGAVALLWTATSAPAPVSMGLGFALALLARGVLWHAWRRRVNAAARALAAIDAAGKVFKLATWLPLLVVLAALAAPLGADSLRLLSAIAGALALAGGLWFKFTLITRAGFNQGFALAHLPVRGVARRKEMP